MGQNAKLLQFPLATPKIHPLLYYCTNRMCCYFNPNPTPRVKIFFLGMHKVPKTLKHSSDIFLSFLFLPKFNIVQDFLWKNVNLENSTKAQK